MGPDVLVMAKPMGPRCNLRCGYCYYLEKEALFPRGSAPMHAALLERYIGQRFAASPGPTHFEWHGGEPTLAGLDTFRTIVRLQKKHAPAGRQWTNGLQTNGLRLDAGWVEFLAENKFSVGLSLDGPAVWHDAWRTTAEGAGSHAKVMASLERLLAAGVFVNLLCVVHSGNVTDPAGVYDFFRATGARYLQFLPYVPRPGKDDPAPAAAPAQLGEFLCAIFDRWLAADVGRLVVQSFDEALRPLYGLPHSLCVHRETCGDVVALEHDGGLYACDHFVDAAHLLGNLKDTDLATLAADPRLAAFGRNKKDGLAAECKRCEVLEFCHGGCPKDRDEGGLNRLCEAYKRFFTHARPGLTALAAHMRAGRSLRSFEYLRR
jgi:uncharacterized protein